MIGNAPKTIQLTDGGTARFIGVHLAASFDGQTDFELERPHVADTPSVLIVNTVTYQVDDYYTLNESLLCWTSDEFQLDPEDELVLHYYTSEN